jgi:hypothetical protein
MDAPKKWQFRFGLKGLLSLVAVCAVATLIYSWTPNYVTTAELSRLKRGMTPDEVRSILGEPDAFTGHVRDQAGNWYYGLLSIVVVFENGVYVEWQEW